MFRKLKDKIAEEVKSSPQRLQQFAQAAQAAVTSASSSISDISNNDLFTIADDDTPQNSPHRATKNSTPSGFQDVSLSHTPSPLHSGSSNDRQETGDTLTPLANNHYNSVKNNIENFDNGPPTSNLGIYPPIPNSARTRRLSNSSTASDVSFRLPSYESPGGMFHLQSDLDISASEMEDNVSVPAQLERVSKEHLYAAYRKTNEKYNKYRGRYTDLARHYKNLERENAKARAVLVETQDKALRRISELREQCQLEQSAKAHLENALRLELDERNLKIESLNTKIKLLQSYGSDTNNANSITEPVKREDGLSEDSKTIVANLINIDENQTSDQMNDLNQNNVNETLPKDNTEIESKQLQEIQNLNNKLQKLEQLLVKCKETIKTHKEKNSQLTSELQIVSDQLEKKSSENVQLGNKIIELTKITSELDEAKEQISKLTNELEAFEQNKQNDMALLKNDLSLAKEEINALNSKIEVLNRREEENVISLAENKLSIHKELEGKENEIKSLNEKISKFNADIKANEIVISDLKRKLKENEDEKSRFKEQISNLEEMKDQVSNLEGKLKEVRMKNQEFESTYTTLVENFHCTEMQLKQETAEKLATIDRNNFLEGRNKKLQEENTSKNKHIQNIEKKLADVKKIQSDNNNLQTEYESVLKEHSELKKSYDELVESKNMLENEIKKIDDNIKTVTNNYNELNVNNKELLENITRLNNELDEARNKNKQYEGENVSFQDQLNVSIVEHEKEIEKYKVELEALRNDLQNISCNKSTQEEMLKKLEIDAEKRFESFKSEIEKKYQDKMEENDLLKKQIEDHTIKYEEKIKECNNVTEELKNLKRELSNLDTEKTTNSDEIEKLTIELNSIKNDYDQQVSSNKQQVMDLEEKLNGLSKDCMQHVSEKETLEQKLHASEYENKDVKSKLNEMVNNITSLQDELKLVKNSHMEILSEKEKIEEKISLMEQYNDSKDQENDDLLKAKILENESLNSTVNTLKLDIDKINEENSDLKNALKKTKEDLDVNESKLKEYSDNNQVWQLKLSNILDDNNTLQEKSEKFKQEKELINEKVAILEQKLNEYESIKVQFEEAKLEKEFLNMRVTQLDTNLKQINAEKSQLMSDNEVLKNDLIKMSNDKKEKIHTLSESIIKFKSDVEILEKGKNDIQILLDKQNVEKEKLEGALRNYTDKSDELEKLREEKETINSKLKETLEKLENIHSVNKAEVDKLTSKLQNMEQKCDILKSKCDELDDLNKKCEGLKIDNDHLCVKIRVLEQVETEHLATIEKMHSLKDENNKLLADIEGLQTHLTKTSKDNSELNHKIRELTANGEVIQAKQFKNVESAAVINDNANKTPVDQNELELQIKQLTEINSKLTEQLKVKEDLNNRILDLERQNSILVEEKLELEDQVKSSMDRHDEHINVTRDPETNDDLKKIRTAYDDLMREKIETESQLANLELMSRSNDSNVKTLEQKNEKLKLTNEKLERRLDEALVSLNHIRTLEENTELEYLRNILYEYLTGPSNNNMILAKVLSAVVKFDHRQTQLVLEREKERQGVLGQLGLL